MGEKSTFKPDFPEQLDENTVRATAFLVFLTAVAGLVTQNWLVLAFLVYEFLGRLIYGPGLSLQVALARALIIKPLKKPFRPTPGAPKRFAQFVGAVFSVAALVSALLGATLVSQVLLGILVFFSFLEFSVGFCAACFLFAQAIRLGLVSEKYCEVCVVRYDIPRGFDPSI
ncbi:MAG: hypothetical protein CMN76_13445 [Spirochaetaceae bacterium]|nr:hypothetical protein [Spirochaetaceae bacterium]|tara:strand:- start:16319 stop:16831 length:513 start_codon:yes stop_codon:yes gene_type:complete